jgi:hypothetical protein
MKVVNPKVIVPILEKKMLQRNCSLMSLQELMME